MSALSEEYVHLFPNLEVYPRIYYFYRRYRDLFTRFSRVTSALPKCFQDDNLIRQLERLKHEFEGGIKVLVIGPDINDLDLVYNADLKLQSAQQHRIEIIVFHLHPKLLCGKECEVTKARIKAVILAAEKIDHKTIVLLKCEQTMSPAESTRFQDDVFAAFKEDLEQYVNTQSNIFIDTNIHDARATISDELERYLAIGFVKIDAQVNLFESINVGVCHEPSHVFEEDSVGARCVKAFITNARAYVEIKPNIDEREKTCSVILEQLLKSLCLVTRCSLADPLARKFGLKVWVCNGVLCEVQFEEALLEAISERTKHQFKQMAYCVYEALSDGKEYSKRVKTCDSLYKYIKADLEPVIANVEKKLHSMKKLSNIFRKMAFETRGYLKQLNIICSPSGVGPMPYISKELRREISSINGVYGLGTVYGQLEIHVDKDKVLADDETSENKHDANNGSKNQKVKGLSKLTSEIASHMRRHHFTEEFSVKYIEREPEKMMFSFEPGDRLFERHREKFGTLGGFIVTNDGKVHGLTCAHVVGVKKQIFIDKNGPEPFSSCPKVVNSKNSELKHIDIAALEVIPVKQNVCKQTLQGHNHSITKANLFDEHPEIIVGSTVYKYGAASGFTKGFVVSVDYNIFGPETEDYLVMVDSQSDLPSGFNGKFDPITCGNGQTSSQTWIEENENSVIIPDKRTLEPLEQRPVSVEGIPFVKIIDLFGVHKSHPNCQRNTSSISNVHNGTGPMQSLESNLAENYSEPFATSTLVFVRNTTFSQSLTRNDEGNSNEVFAKKGDSGSIICIHEATRENVKHKALSMLYAGDFKIAGDESLKCLSFKLNVGLQMLKQAHGLDF